jgi:hypothetical protein
MPAQAVVVRTPTQPVLVRTPTQPALVRLSTQPALVRTPTQAGLIRLPTQLALTRTPTQPALVRIPTQGISVPTRPALVRTQAIKELVPQLLQPKSEDSIGYGIFTIFDRKYRADKIFDGERRNISQLHETHQVTDPGYLFLNEIVNLYQERYNKFIDDIETKRIFYEKSGFGKPPRSIKTEQDWAEAIIELNDLVSSFKRDIKTHSDIKRNVNNIKKECVGFEANETACQLPCKIEKPLLFKQPSCGFKN